jgi:DNA polymerase-3 subunit gamma/tau
VLDQLAAGSGEDGISYERALSILGYTDAALLDETVDAFAAGDGAAVFSAVDRVIEAGIDPRRFAQDLLERFRDLLVLDAVADASETGLLDQPADALERMRGQAARMGRASLSRAGDVMAQALVDMRGTTSPRLVLELACARVLLPGAASDTSALLARLDRLERRLSVAPAAPSAAVAESDPIPAPSSGSGSAQPELAVSEAPVTVAEAPVAAAPGALDVVALRRIWPDLLDAVNANNKTAAALLKNAEPTAVDAKALTVSFSTPELARMFTQKGVGFLTEALQSVVGADLRIDVGVAGTQPANGAAAAAAPAPEEIDVSDSADADDEPPADPVALLQSNLGAQVIGEIDSA